MGRKVNAQAGFATFPERMYRRAPDVSTGFCRIHFVRRRKFIALASMFRKAFTADYAAIAAVWRSAWQSANPQVATVEPLKHWLSRARSEFAPPNEPFAVELQGRVVAFDVVNSELRHLHQLFVSPDHQRRGLGAKIVQHISEGFPNGWALHVGLKNERARRFYERCGLQVGEVDCNPVTGRPRVRYEFPGSVKSNSGDA